MKELEEGSALALDFNKLTKAISTCPGVIPVAVQHADTREVILVAYTNELALKKAIAERTAIFWSTSRVAGVWMGLPTGNSSAKSPT